MEKSTDKSWGVAPIIEGYGGISGGTFEITYEERSG